MGVASWQSAPPNGLRYLLVGGSRVISQGMIGIRASIAQALGWGN